jgi:hypothetical protein
MRSSDFRAPMSDECLKRASADAESDAKKRHHGNSKHRPGQRSGSWYVERSEGRIVPISVDDF